MWYRMADGDAERLVGENRCWACTITNGLVALVIAAIPLYGALGTGDPVVVGVTVVWAVVVVGFTLVRLVTRGYLPGSERIAKATGLHERIGPGRHEAEGGTDPEETGEERGGSPGS